MPARITDKELMALQHLATYRTTNNSNQFKEAAKLAEESYDKNPTASIPNLVLAAVYAELYQRKPKDYFRNKFTNHCEQYNLYNDLDESISRSLESLFLAAPRQQVSAIPPGKVTSYHKLQPTARFYDTSTNAPKAIDHSFVENFSQFSPFQEHIPIPIPHTNETSATVEGIWQGLKIIKGRTDPSYFLGKGRKRYGKPSGHAYGNTKLSYDKARQKIYKPAYEYLLDNTPELQADIQRIVQRAMHGVKQYIFDVDENVDPTNLNGPLAHSAILANYLNEAIKQQSTSQQKQVSWLSLE